jgi:hypothetical protein
MDATKNMIEVNKKYFERVIHSLNVHVCCNHEEYTEWKLNGYSLIAITTPGYATYYDKNGIINKNKYFVIPEYANK